MLLGLTNTAAASMNLLNRVFKQYLEEFAVVFVNGILIYSKSWKEHEKHLHLAEVFEESPIVCQV